MSKQHLVMLAHPFNEKKHGIAGWFASEKLDGHRALWIPGTRGLKKQDVPFANLYDTKRHDQITTGLWSRYGNVIVAPDEWLDTLPMTFLDGELWLGRDSRQKLSSIIKQLEPDKEDWGTVSLCCFDMPSPEALFADRHINLTNFNRVLVNCLAWWESLNVALEYRPKPTTPFQSTVVLLEKYCCGRATTLKQFQLKFQSSLARIQIDTMIEKISLLDGEGLILRDPSSKWMSERSHKLLKVKPLHDDEGTVIGYITGRKTDKGSKLLGLMGALILNFHGRRLELSGFTDEERRLDWTPDICRAEVSNTPTGWATEHPGEEVPYWIEAPEFPRGTKVTFKFRDLTTDGIPNEARYHRVREDL